MPLGKMSPNNNLRVDVAAPAGPWVEESEQG